MGVSITQWRSAIGCHCSNSIKISTKPFNTSSSTFSMTRIRLLLWMLTLIGIFIILTYSVYSSSILHSTRPPSTSQPIWPDPASTSSSQWPAWTTFHQPTWQISWSASSPLLWSAALWSSWQPHRPVPWPPPRSSKRSLLSSIKRSPQVQASQTQDRQLQPQQHLKQQDFPNNLLWKLVIWNSPGIVGVGLRFLGTTSFQLEYSLSRRQPDSRLDSKIGFRKMS